MPFCPLMGKVNEKTGDFEAEPCNKNCEWQIKQRCAVRILAVKAEIDIKNQKSSDFNSEESIPQP
jgi:hypothetical protein